MRIRNAELTKTVWLRVLFVMCICLFSTGVLPTLANAEEPEQYIVNDFTVGGIKVSDSSGIETSNRQRMRTGFWPLEEITAYWDYESGLEYFAVYYDEDYSFLKATSFQANSKVFSENDVNEAKFIRFVLRNKDETDFDSLFQLPEGCRIVSCEKYETFFDVPENKGVQNVLSRAEQCINISYTTASLLPGQAGDVEKDTYVQGIMYSSTRLESLYVPNAVSFESYLTAIQNPNSYIYSRQSDTQNSKTYYGTVCSAFVSYCFNLPCIYTTHQLGKLETMIYQDEQNIDSIHLGDLLLREDRHVRIVVGVERDKLGRVVHVMEAEAIPPQVCVKTCTRIGFKKDLQNSNYRIYRYALIDQIPEPNTDIGAIRVNDTLCPRRGNKANWPLGETVEIDILNPEGYDRAELSRDGELVDISDIPESLCLRYDGLDSGKYEVCLSDGEHRSEAVFFIVVDTNVTAEYIGNGEVKVSFSSSNAMPSWYAWCFPREPAKDYLAVSRAYVLSQEDRERGYVITGYMPGEWIFKVEFETEYGQISGVCSDIYVYAQGETATWQELQSALNSGGTVTLARDIISGIDDTALIIPVGVSAELDLAGYRIIRSIDGGECVDGDSVITVEGTLKLCDSIGSGSISGGASIDGIKVNGSLTMNGGEIIKSRTGVKVSNYGAFSMCGGEIHDNKIGVDVAENTEFAVSGTVSITDNSAHNIYLSGGAGPW